MLAQVSYSWGARGGSSPSSSRSYRRAKESYRGIQTQDDWGTPEQSAWRSNGSLYGLFFLPPFISFVYALVRSPQMYNNLHYFPRITHLNFLFLASRAARRSRSRSRSRSHSRNRGESRAPDKSASNAAEGDAAAAVAGPSDSSSNALPTDSQLYVRAIKDRYLGGGMKCARDFYVLFFNLYRNSSYPKVREFMQFLGEI